jgi:hypothetical protein
MPTTKSAPDNIVVQYFIIPIYDNFVVTMAVRTAVTKATVIVVVSAAAVVKVAANKLR